MSSTLRNGETRDLNLTATDYITLVAVSGTYTATVVRGNSSGTVLGTNVTGGTYGPYTGGAVIRVATSASSEVDFDIGASPIITSDTYVLASTNPVTGGISLSVGSNSIQIASGVKITNPKGLRRWRAARSLAEYGVARVNCLGDSITLGSYSNDTSIPVDSIADAQGYVGRLRNMLARSLNTTPAGFIAANDSRNTLSGGAASASVGPIINTVRTDNVTTLGGAITLSVGNTITVPVPACTNIEIVYMDSTTNSAQGGAGTATGTFSYNVDSTGATTTVADNTAPINYKRISITGLSNATHSLVITGVTGTCFIWGVFYYGANGVCVSRLGLGGATALDLINQGVVTHGSTGGTQRIQGSFGPSAAPVNLTCGLTSGSPIATTASTSGIQAGMPIGATSNLALPTFIKSVDSATQFTMTADATGTNAAQGCWIGAGTTITADLWIIPIGHNDWAQQNSAYPTPVSVFTSTLQTLINTFTNQGACVLLVGEPKSNNASPTPETYAINNYWTVLDELAAANSHVASIQINAQWGSFATASASGFNSVGGGVHPLKKGSADMATLINSVLGYVATEVASV